jgi:excisionase family DNA binding protein
MSTSKVALAAALLTYEQTAELLNVRIGTLYSWVSRRAIPFVRVGPRVVRFSRSDIDLWLAERRVTPDSAKSAS